jgi:PST family polysaccharide transporter
VIENQDPVDVPKERDPEDVVATKRSASSMRGMALTGGRWVALEGIVIQGLQVVSTMVLARLLTPDDFGIVAVVSLVLILFAILTNIGFSASVVRRETVSRRYLSSMFWASSSVGLAATLGAALLAPLFSTMAGNPAAAPYLVVASVTILFGMVKSVPRALLLRDFRFRDISAAVVLGFVAYIAIAITLAATTDLGAWAIVLGRVANSAIMLGTQWFMSRFVPLLQLRRADVREDLGFNFAFLGMRGSQYLSKNIDYWYVGWALGPTALGTYYIAYVLPNLLRRRMTTAVSGPLFVTVTGFATDRDRVRRAYLNATKFISLGAYPVLIGMALVSDEMIRVAFGRQWLAAIEPMAILAIAAAVNVIGPVGSGILTAVGKPIRNVVVNLTWSGMIVIGLAVVTTNGSLTYVAFVILVTTVLALVLQVALLRGPIDLHWGSVLQSIWPATASTMVMALTVAGTRMLMGDLGGVVVRLVVLVAAGAIAYVGFGFLAFRKTFTKARGDVRTVFVKT